MRLLNLTITVATCLLACPPSLTPALVFAQTPGTVTLKKRFAPPPVEINEENWKHLWEELAGADPEEARYVMQNIMLYPEDSTPFLRKSIKPAPAAEDKKVQALLRDLDNPRYSKRALAHQQLKKMGSAVKAALARTLKETKSSEVQWRVSLLLRHLQNKAKIPDELRLWRALNVLEYIGTKGAREHLQELAKGARGHWLTEEAVQSLARITKREKSIQLVGKIKPARTFNGHTSTVTCMAIDPTSQILASGSYDNTVRLWNLQTGQLITVLRKHTSNIRLVAFSTDGKTLISTDSNRRLVFWDVAQRKEIAYVLSGHTSYVRSMAVSPDGKYLATACRQNVKLWDIETRKCVATLRGHTSYIYGLAFSPNGKFLVSSGTGGIINIWDMRTRDVDRVIRLQGIYARSVAFTPDSETLLLGTGALVKVWELSTNGEMDQFPGHTSTIYELALHPDGRTVFTVASDRTVRLWDRFTGRELAKLSIGSSSTLGLALSPDGRFLVSQGTSTSTLQSWELAEKTKTPVPGSKAGDRQGAVANK